MNSAPAAQTITKPTVVCLEMCWSFIKDMVPITRQAICRYPAIDMTNKLASLGNEEGELFMPMNCKAINEQAINKVRQKKLYDQ